MSRLERIFNSKFFLTLISILIAFVVGAIFLLAMGISPLLAYEKLISGALSTPQKPFLLHRLCDAADLYRPRGGLLVPDGRV